METAKATTVNFIIGNDLRRSNVIYNSFTVNTLLNSNSRVLPVNDCPKELAKKFSEFFLNKVKKIRNIIDDVHIDPSSPLEGRKFPSHGSLLHDFRPVTEDDLLRIIMKSPTKTCALDPLPTWLLKRHSSVILPKLTEVVNASLEQGAFPNSLGHAIVTPILKKSSLDRNDLKNYRPVSSISSISKYIEKVVSARLTEHINHHNLFEPLQSAYRNSHSTETALLSVQDHVLKAIDQQKAILFVMLDLSAAFDTLDHGIMLHHFQESFGISGNALQWFSSYFNCRTNHVHVPGADSTTTNLDYGTPQGSVIGPLSFTLYTVPIGEILRKHNMLYHMYADDIQIYSIIDPKIPLDAECALFNLSTCVKDIQHWMVANKLKLNADKTDFIIISSKTASKALGHLKFTFENTTISPAKSVRNLGVVFDSRMSMDDHVAQMSKNTNFHLRNIAKIRPYIDEDTCHSVVRSLVLSRLDYCNSLLKGTTKKNINRLQKVQNKAARLIFKTGRHDNISPLFQKLHWLPISNRIDFKLCLHVFKSLAHQSPSYISDMLQPYVPPRSLRSSSENLLAVHRTVSRAGSRAFSASAPNLWNSLPSHLRHATSHKQFKKLLKTHLYRNT